MDNDVESKVHQFQGLRPLLVYVQPIYHLQGLGWTEGAGT